MTAMSLTKVFELKSSKPIFKPLPQDDPRQRKPDLLWLSRAASGMES